MLTTYLLSLCHHQFMFSTSIDEKSFNADRIAASKREKEEQNMDDDYYRYSTDIGDDILFTAGTVSSARSSFQGSLNLNLSP